MKILLFGASGSGTSTLGREIEKKSNFKHLDVDDYYWKPTNPPYQEKVPLGERNQKLTTDFQQYENVIVSGSMVSWGKEWESVFDLVVFIYLNPTIRIQRLQQREFERYGNKLLTDEKVKQASEDFIEWAKKYDEPDFTGRSLKVHRDWIELLDCPVLELDGAEELEDKVNSVLAEKRWK
ncbi:MAG: adenylate kinase family enzyme [Flammeovirgaceae bacterium]|jgi:adenylate kinase family enzyme